MLSERCLSSNSPILLKVTRYYSERIGNIMFSDISVQLGSVIIYVPLVILSHFTRR